MRVEQKVHERGFLCVSLWVCNEQPRLKYFSEMAKVFFLLAKVLAKDYVYFIHTYMYVVSSAYVYTLTFVRLMISGPWAFCESKIIFFSYI